MSTRPLKEPLPAVIALVGDEDKKKDELLAAILKAKGADACVLHWSKDRADGGAGEAARILADLRSRPLFGGAKVIVARDGEALLKATGNGLLAAVDIASGNHLVLVLRSLDLRTTLGKGLDKAGSVIKCMRPKADLLDARGAGSELLQAVIDEAKRKGVALAPDAARELAGRTGNDLLLVSTELDKLALYLHESGAPASVADVDALVPQSAAWDQFRLFEEVANGQTGRAILRVRGMLRHGTADARGKRNTDPNAIALTVLALLTRRLRLLARYRALTAAGVRDEPLREALGIKNPGQLYYLGKEANLPLVRAAEGAIGVLAEADRQLKTSAAEPELVLERALVVLSRRAAGAAATAAVLR